MLAQPVRDGSQLGVSRPVSGAGHPAIWSLPQSARPSYFLYLFSPCLFLTSRLEGTNARQM